MQLFLEFHFIDFCIGAIHFYQCVRNLLGYFCIFVYAQSWNSTHSHKTSIIFFKNSMSRFVNLHLLWCKKFQESGFLFIINYEFAITFTHQKNHNPKFFHTWKFILFKFSIIIWKRSYAISQGNIYNLSWNFTKDLLQKGFFLFFGILGLGV